MRCAPHLCMFLTSDPNVTAVSSVWMSPHADADVDAYVNAFRELAAELVVA